MKLKITIPLMCRPKKNSQRIIYNKRTNRPMIIQSEQYKEFEQACGYYLRRYTYRIKNPINLKCTFYFPDRRKRDTVNMLEAIQDILVKYKVIDDDNYNIVASLDGTRCIYEKDREETIIEIEDINE